METNKSQAIQTPPSRGFNELRAYYQPRVDAAPIFWVEGHAGFQAMTEIDFHDWLVRRGFSVNGSTTNVISRVRRRRVDDIVITSSLPPGLSEWGGRRKLIIPGFLGFDAWSSSNRLRESAPSTSRQTNAST